MLRPRLIIDNCCRCPHPHRDIHEYAIITLVQHAELPVMILNLTPNPKPWAISGFPNAQAPPPTRIPQPGSPGNMEISGYTPSSLGSTWRFMGSYKWGYKPPNKGFRYSYLTYNRTYNYP